MDPRVTWYQPEQLGPATTLWTQIFDSATEELQNFHVGDSMSKGGTGNPSPASRSTTTLDYIPLNGDTSTAAANKKKSANGFIFGDRQDTINRKRKDNLASTYDWNHSGKLRNGGTPWRMPGQRYTGVIGLHQEIMDFYNFMLPRHEEHLMRKEVVHRIQGIVRSIWPDAKVEIYGSYRTMLYLPTSDIDLVLFGDIGDCPFFRLGNELEKSGIAEPGSIKVLDKASVPIVKLTDNLTKVRVDISFNMQTGTQCAKLIEEFIQQFPSLPFLVFTLKQFLLQRDLNEVWTGGISSYSLILMIVSFLQLHAPPEPENLGVLLIEFFELYGNNFNYFKTGISVVDGGYYFSKEDAQKKMTQGYRTSLLCIEDPLNPGLDICKSSYGFMAVRQAFHYAYRVLCQGVLPHIDQENDVESILGRIIRVTDEVITYRRWIHQNWYHKVAHLALSPAMFPNMHYLQMVAASQLPLPDNTAIRIGNTHQRAVQAANNNNVCGSDATRESVEGRVAPAGQGSERRTEVPVKAQRHLPDMCNSAATLPSNNESEVNSAGTLSSPSSQDDLSSASDAESEHSSQTSGSSKDMADSSPPEQLKPIAKAVISVKNAVTPTIIVSSSTAQRTGTPPIIKPSPVLSLSNPEAVLKPRMINKEVIQSGKGNPVISSSITVTPSNDTHAVTSSPVVKVPASVTVTSMQQPVTSRTYRNKTHQFHAQQQQGGSKFRSATPGGSSSINNNSTAGNGGVSGGKRFKRKHKRDSQISGR